MPFDPVDPKQNFPDLERGILQYWKEEDTFKRSIRQRSKKGEDILAGPEASATEESFSFYDGPPFATGLPHYGHLLAGTIKDVIPRYQTMRGKKVIRRFGWDCHGLPIENLIEKEHNITSKKQIEEMGIKAFNDLCRGAVQRYTKEWRVVVERTGRWVDMDWDYRTMDPEYMESIWWVFSKLAEKNLIVEGHKPMHVCPRCVTPLSNFEVTQGYKDVTDLSATVMFRLKDAKGAQDPSTSLRAGAKTPTYMLAWTTTPWTLPGNLFLAVHPKTLYATVEHDGKTFILAESLVEKVFKGKDHAVVGKTVTGKSLVGTTYEPLFPYFADAYAETAFRVVAGDFVTTEDGTGIVHIAPGFGEDDFGVGKREKAPLLQHVTMEGKFVDKVTDFAGMDVKPKEEPSKADKAIGKYLQQKGHLFDQKSYTHSYPHCWRCDSPLLNYATSSWFVAVEKMKESMLTANSETAWVPAHLRDGRFGKWLEGARDWAISRNRYWGTPLPIWRNAKTKEMEVIGGRDDLFTQVPHRFTKVTTLRHAESEGNLIPIYQGEVPGTPLTKRGGGQAKAAGDALAGDRHPVTVVYCSPLQRTRETAEAVAKATGARVVVDERLREVRFGEYEGKTVDFSDLTFVKARRAHKLETGKVESIYHFPGMETWSEVHARIESFLAEVLPRHHGEHIAIVTHADPCLNLRNVFTKEDPAKLCHQPYPSYAEPMSYFWDHAARQSLDLHKETVDGIAWEGGSDDGAVEAVLVRHGETDWNRDGKCQGREADRPLTDRGREQARECAATLKKKKVFDVVICSDMKRARETAEIIAKELGLTVAEALPELRERGIGDWVGRTNADILKDHPLDVLNGELGLHHSSGKNGERLADFLQRAEAVREHLLATYPGKRVLVVSHGGFLKAMRMVADRLPYHEALAYAPANCETAAFTFRPLLRRIPEVLDCWFESGSMPYAQGHFPFSYGYRVSGVGNNAKRVPATRHSTLDTPPGFPADFIAEGIDQTRGWFYTLTVLGAALYGRSPFRNCIVNGTVLAEDGKKMSKRLKNYPDPLELAEKHGADAMRFALMSSPAVRGEDLRFGEKLVAEQLRNVLLPLWNTYAFFVTYANAANWEAGSTRRTSGHSLDRYIRAEVQDLVNRMTEQLEHYDLSATCAELGGTIDALTNWYVRLSRRRFAGKAGLSGPGEAMEEMHEGDRLDALNTLYDVLLTVAQLLAPFCPFAPEAIYLNLVREDHGSIHLTDWPVTRELTVAEQALLRKTRLLRTIVSLGLQIRSEKKVKVRQPLARATIAVPRDLLKAHAIDGDELALLREELNVKAVDLVADAGAIAESYAQVDARKVGPRLGGRVQEIIKAGKAGEFFVEKDGSILILDVRLSPGEATVVYRGKEGTDVAADKGVVVSLDTHVTPALQSEGRARDLIRQIQQLRKDAGLSFTDRIALSIEGADDLVRDHGKTIASAVNADLGKADGEAKTVDLEGETITLRFQKI